MFSSGRSACPRSSSYALVYLYMIIVHTYAAFTIDPSCSPDILANSISEAQVMAGNAATLTQNSLNLAITDPVEDWRITMNYSPWFGDILSRDAQGNPQDNEQTDRANQVIATLNAVQMGIQIGSPSLTIRCGDPPITVQQGARIATQGQNTFAVNFFTCVDKPSQIAYTLPIQGLIVLCQPASRLPPLVGGPITPLPNGQLLDRQRTLSNVLLHELMHVFGGPNIIGDQDGATNPTSEQYGYQACTTMRQNHVNLAPNNPDSIAMYAQSLLMNQNDWSTGVAAPLLQPGNPNQPNP